MVRSVSVFLAWTLGGMVLVLAACRPVEPLDRPITAATEQTYNQWTYRTLVRLGPREQEEFRAARREMLLAIQMRSAGLPPADQHARQRQLLNGRSAREVIIEGYVLRLTRLRAADQEDRALLYLNEQRILGGRMSPNGVAYLAERMGPIKDRQSARAEEITAIETRLDELGAAAPPAAEPNPPGQPGPPPPPDPRKIL